MEQLCSGPELIVVKMSFRRSTSSSITTTTTTKTLRTTATTSSTTPTPTKVPKKRSVIKTNQ